MKLSRNSLHTFVDFINACSVIYRVIQSSSTIFNDVEETDWSWKGKWLFVKICHYFKVKYIYSDVIVYYCDHVTGALHWEIMDVDNDEQISYLDSSVGNKKNANKKKSRFSDPKFAGMHFVLEPLSLHWGNSSSDIWIKDILTNVYLKWCIIIWEKALSCSMLILGVEDVWNMEDMLDIAHFF